MDRVVASHGRRLKGLAAALLRSPDEAEEAVQETFLAAWKSCADLREGTDLGAWLATICMNACRMRQRSRARERRALYGWSLLRPTRDTDRSLLEEAERQQAFLRELSALEPELREAFLLVAVERVPLEQAAGALDCTVHEVRKRIGRAVGILRMRLGPFLG